MTNIQFTVKFDSDQDWSNASVTAECETAWHVSQFVGFWKDKLGLTDDDHHLFLVIRNKDGKTCHPGKPKVAA